MRFLPKTNYLIETWYRELECPTKTPAFAAVQLCERREVVEHSCPHLLIQSVKDFPHRDDRHVGIGLAHGFAKLRDVVAGRRTGRVVRIHLAHGGAGKSPAPGSEYSI